MKSFARLLMVTIVIVLLTGSIALARDPGFPDVEYLGFNATTFTYTYRVTCFTDCLYPLGRLTVRTEVANVLPYKPWSATGPITDPASTAWVFSITRRSFSPLLDNANWTAPSGQAVPAATGWVGLFTLTVPNTQPKLDGLAVTMAAAGGEDTQDYHSVTVPGPTAVPEPSSLLALGGLSGGLLALLRRRR